MTERFKGIGLKARSKSAPKLTASVLPPTRSSNPPFSVPDCPHTAVLTEYQQKVAEMQVTVSTEKAGYAAAIRRLQSCLDLETERRKDVEMQINEDVAKLRQSIVNLAQSMEMNISLCMRNGSLLEKSCSNSIEILKDRLDRLTKEHCKLPKRVDDQQSEFKLERTSGDAPKTHTVEELTAECEWLKAQCETERIGRTLAEAKAAELGWIVTSLFQQ